MLMQSGYRAAGWLGIINGSKLYVDFSTGAFDEAFKLLVREIEAIRISLGADDIQQMSGRRSVHSRISHRRELF